MEAYLGEVPQDLVEEMTQDPGNLEAKKELSQPFLIQLFLLIRHGRTELFNQIHLDQSIILIRA